MYMKTSIVGALAKDAQMRYTAEGKAIVNFSIPVNFGWGENQKTVWCNLSWFGTWAETKYNTGKMTKGTLVLVDAEFNGTYTGKDENVSLNYTVRDYKVVRNSGTVMEVDTETDDTEDWDDEEDELPF